MGQGNKAGKQEEQIVGAGDFGAFDAPPSTFKEKWKRTVGVFKYKLYDSMHISYCKLCGTREVVEYSEYCKWCEKIVIDMAISNTL
jgi:hypothetical protein